VSLIITIDKLCFLYLSVSLILTNSVLYKIIFYMSVCSTYVYCNLNKYKCCTTSLFLIILYTVYVESLNIFILLELKQMVVL
jgi:hypothetical protein